MNSRPAIDEAELLDALGEAVLAIAPDGVIAHANRASGPLLGWPGRELEGRRLEEIVPARHHHVGRTPITVWARNTLRPGETLQGRAVLRRREGLELAVDLSVTRHEREDGPWLLVTLRSIHESAPAAPDELEPPQAPSPAIEPSELEGRYRAVFENAPIGIIHFDEFGFITAVNEPIVATLGSSRRVLVGLDMTTLHDAKMITAVREALAGRRASYEGEYRSITGGKTATVRCEFRPILDRSGAVRGGVCIVDDVTERRAIQARLVQADRLASVGTLAAGVAHELNNPLAYVIASLELASSMMTRLGAREAPGAAVSERGAGAADEQARIIESLAGSVDNAREGAERVRRIVRDLKLFSRVEPDRRDLVDVESVLDASIKLAWNEIRHRARLVKRYSGAPAIWGDDARLAQVCLNLLVNAAQAIPPGRAADHEIRVGTGVDEGRVFIEVSDTGKGIDRETLAHIFEPFFTTKPVGQGTGLGLSICHGIVQGLGGEITVESEPGRGSTFRVLLPPAARTPARSVPAPPLEPAEGNAREGTAGPGAHEAHAHGRPAKASDQLEPEGDARGRARILVVDDEAILARTLRMGLAPRHEVIVATSGREALAVLERDDAFDLVLCDLMMPDLTGFDLYERLAAHAVPGGVHERFVFMTGGVFTQQAQDFLRSVPNPCLEKPFDLTQLDEVLARLRRHGPVPG